VEHGSNCTCLTDVQRQPAGSCCTADRQPTIQEAAVAANRYCAYCTPRRPPETGRCKGQLPASGGYVRFQYPTGLQVLIDAMSMEKTS